MVKLNVQHYGGAAQTLTQGFRNSGSMGSIVICDTLIEPAENWKIQGGRYSSVLGIICLLGLTDLLTFAPPAHLPLITREIASLLTRDA